MINNVVLCGRAGSDPTVKTFNSGSKVAELNMAVKRWVKDQDEATDWFKIKLWGQLADTAQNYIKKGHLFGITGELQEERWEENGNKRSKIVIIARSLKLMQPKADGSQESEQHEQESQEEHREQTAEDIFSGSESEETPF